MSARPPSWSTASPSGSGSTRSATSRSRPRSCAAGGRATTSSGRCGTSRFEIPAGLDVRADRRERLGQVDAAQVHRPHPAARTRGAITHARARWRRCSSSVPASTRSCPAGRTSTSTAPSSGMTKTEIDAQVRRDRRLRRRRAVHRPAGEELLLGHVRAPRVLGRDQRRPRHPAGRRGARRRRRGVPGEVHGEVRRLPPRGQDRRHRQPRHGLDADHVRPGRLAATTASSSRSGAPTTSSTSYVDEGHDDAASRRSPTAATALGLAARPARPTVELLDATGTAGDATSAPATRSPSGCTTRAASGSTSRCSAWRSRPWTACTSGRTTRRDGRPRLPDRSRAPATIDLRRAHDCCCSRAPIDLNASIVDYTTHAHLRLPAALLPVRRRARRAPRVRRDGRRWAATWGISPTSPTLGRPGP